MRMWKFMLSRLQLAVESGRILPYLMTTIAALAVGFGFLMWLVDREDFPTFGRALWWAVQTVTTVGYGDATPVQPAGRILATVLMIVGFASLSLLTGIIASLLVHRRTAAAGESDFAKIDARLDELERLLRSNQAD
jgi:voltage-gated potassium channel Kch